MKIGDINAAVRREIVRAVYERVQSMNLDYMGQIDAEGKAQHFEDVEELLNNPYMNRDEVALVMDIFKPKVPEGTELPVIVTLHGGGMMMGDRRLSRAFCRNLAHRGYLVFSLEYRLAPRANVCQSLDDVCAGLDLVGAKLVDFDVDFSRVFIAAESAGAYLAAYVSAMKGSKKLQEAIGYEPSRLGFKAIGLITPMLYTNMQGVSGWMLTDQLYGSKRTDENFLQYMDPENPEIVNNLPPVFLTTCKGDFLNNSAFKMNEALKKAGKPCHLLYYGDEDLMHAFTTMQSYHPKTLDCIDRMLAWFEEQAALEAGREKKARTAAARKKKMLTSMMDGSCNNRKIWQYLKDRASVEPERLAAPAILDCSRTWTYGQMFDEWDRYARVFSGLGMTGASHSRVAIVGSISAEPLFAYYALNMTGACVSMFSYPDLLPGGRWKTMVEKEHITDMIISDIIVTPQMWEELKQAKAEFGLGHIILVHSRMGGPCTGYAEMLYNEFNYTALKRLPDTEIMEDLLEQYKDTPITLGKPGGDEIAVICHTSGTSNGTRKPLPYTDRMVNALASAAPTGVPLNVLSGMKKGMAAGGPPAGVPGGPPAGAPAGMPADMPAGMPAEAKKVPAGVPSFIPKRMVMIPPFDFSASSNINGFVNMTFASGNTTVLTCFGFLHPKFVRALKYYNADLVFASGFMVDQWMQIPDLPEDAFASLKVMGFGGSYLAPTKLDKYDDFLKAHGFKGLTFQGYGMSELAGGLFIVPPDCKDDIIGFPDNIENFRVFDETDGKFHKISEGEREGVFYGRSDSMCLNMLDGEKLFDLTEIDGLGYVCMNDVVHVNPNGSISYVGRSNQFFANNDGVTFESGLVEKQMASQPAIDMCAIVPVLDKRIHDTVPVLYVVPAHKGGDAAEEIRRAIADVFVNDEKLKGSILPTQFMIVDSIPLSASGKIDVYHITRSRLSGTAYNIIPVKENGVLTDIRYEKADQLNSFTGGTLPEGMGKDSAYNSFEAFSAAPEFLRVRAAVKKDAAALKERRKAAKEAFAAREVPLPKIKIDQSSMPKMPKLPEPLQTIATMAMIAAGLTESDYDYEE